MLELVHRLPAEDLELKRYLDDFQEHFWTCDISWKLERQESFREPRVASWVAMERGDWDTAMRLIDEMRTTRAEHQRKLAQKGITQRRIRVVSRPLSPYLQWELHALRLWAELGEQIRVQPAQAVRHLERVRKLPEILVLGGECSTRPVMYEIVYQDGELSGARKFTDRALIAECRAEIAALWRKGEDLLRYFDREIASLPPPSPQAV
jgi:hypothetical protein